MENLMHVLSGKKKKTEKKETSHLGNFEFHCSTICCYPELGTSKRPFKQFASFSPPGHSVGLSA